MNIRIFLLLIFAHMISDFVFQPNYIVKLRYSEDTGESLRGNFLHVLICLGVSFLLTVNYLSVEITLVVVAVCAFHLLVDFIKSIYISKNPFAKHSVAIFLLDQTFHISYIALIFLPGNINKYITAFNHINAGDNFNVFKSMEYVDRLLISGILIIIALWGTGIFIKIFFDYLKSRPYKRAINMSIKLKDGPKESSGAKDGGFIIGILERLFIICSIVLNLPQVIGFVLATKSIARFKRFDDDEFVEIFIIGSFISFISAIIVGVIVKGLDIIPY